MNLKIALTLLSIIPITSLRAEQPQIVAHAITHDEKHQVNVNDLLLDLKLIAQNLASLDEVVYCNFLLNKYSDTTEFRFLCSFFDLMRHEGQEIIINNNHSEFSDALYSLKEVLGCINDSSLAIIDIKLYKLARYSYKTHMNCPQFAFLFNLFKRINESSELREDQRITDERIKRVKRLAIGALAGFTEGMINTLVE